ncbi:MAG: hypothetical protein AAF667_07470 [Pseudomonadota bacterium]
MENDLWSGALCGFQSERPSLELARLVKAVAKWMPEHAARNHARALAKLDWRWRLLKIADFAGTRPKALTDDIARLRARLQELNTPTVDTCGHQPIP